MQLQFTAVFKEVPEGGYVGLLEELPGANTQGETLEEARANLREAATLIIETNRVLAEEELRGGPVIREPLHLTGFWRRGGDGTAPSENAVRVFRSVNLGLMNQGPTPWGASHCFPLADHFFSEPALVGRLL